jgi:hypothetical protein
LVVQQRFGLRSGIYRFLVAALCDVLPERHTYDGVIRGHPDPAIIAICGLGPVKYALVDPSQPG